MNWSVTREPTLIVTALIYGVLAVICIRAGLFGIWLGVLLLLSFYRYCYSVLLYFARGYSRIPPPDLDSFNPVGQWGVVFHFVAFPGLILATAPYQPIGSVVAVLVALVFPASAALMALSSSLSHSLNPAALTEFARTLGRDYRTLVLSSVAIALGSVLIQVILVPRSGFFSLALPMAVLYWGAFAIFALIGSALRAHRLEFEIAGELVPEEDRLRQHLHDEWRKDLDIAYGAFRSDMASTGYTTLRKLVAANGDSLEINHWLFDNMLEWRDKRYAIEIAAKLMPRLLAAGDAAGALEVYQRCRRHQPEIRLAPDLAAELAEHAAAFGKTGLANELNYGARSPGNS